MSASINDSVVTQNISETLTELLMLKESDPNFKFNHTCPSYLSKYRFYSEGYGAHNNSVSGFFDQVESKPKNGAYYDWEYCKDANGTPLDENDPDPTRGRQDSNDATMYAINYTVFVKLRCSENLMLSPFQFDNDNRIIAVPQ